MGQKTEISSQNPLTYFSGSQGFTGTLVRWLVSKNNKEISSNILQWNCINLIIQYKAE